MLIARSYGERHLDESQRPGDFETAGGDAPRSLRASGARGANLLGALGGCWWPIEITPLWAQRFALLLPTGWVMDGLHKLISFGEPVAAVLPHLAITSAVALAAGGAAVRSFRWE